MPTNCQPEVHVEGGWSANTLRFTTEAEAQSYAADLIARWTLVRDSRAVQRPRQPHLGTRHAHALARGGPGLTKLYSTPKPGPAGSPHTGA